MPYLHWETDRNRSRMAEVADQIGENRERRLRRKNKEAKAARIKKFLSLANISPGLPKIVHDFPNYYVDHGDKGGRFATPGKIENILWHVTKESFRRDLNNRNRARSGGQKKKRDDDLENGTYSSTDTTQSRDEVRTVGDVEKDRMLQISLIDSTGRLRPRHPLAQYLVDVARLYEAIRTYRDKQALKKFLFSEDEADELCLHPRRTLDQAYFWKLKSTRRRDRDQVVYRYTRAEFPHRFREKPRKGWVQRQLG